MLENCTRCARKAVVVCWGLRWCADHYFLERCRRGETSDTDRALGEQLRQHPHFAREQGERLADYLDRLKAMRA